MNTNFRGEDLLTPAEVADILKGKQSDGLCVVVQRRGSDGSNRQPGAGQARGPGTVPQG